MNLFLKHALSVHADDGITALSELLPVSGEITKLLVAVGTVVGAKTFAIGVEGVVQLPQQTADRVRTDPQAQLGQLSADGSQVFAGPQASPAHGIPGRVLLQQGAQPIQDSGRFFSTAVRPAPA